MATWFFGGGVNTRRLAHATTIYRDFAVNIERVEFPVISNSFPQIYLLRKTRIRRYRSYPQGPPKLTPA
jgi:hypothetical protein